MLLLSIAKWRNLLTSQLLVYDGDRHAPLDLLNLLPEEIDLDPDTWLMHHMLILAFLRRIANASNIQPKIFLKESIHIYKIFLDMNEFPPNICIVGRLWYFGEISPELEKPQLEAILLYLLHCLESYAMHTLFLNSRSFILKLE